MTDRAELLEELRALNQMFMRHNAPDLVHPEILTRHLSDADLLEVVMGLELELRKLERVQAEQSHLIDRHRGD